jgi:hypothetical protein
MYFEVICLEKKDPNQKMLNQPLLGLLVSKGLTDIQVSPMNHFSHNIWSHKHLQSMSKLSADLFLLQKWSLYKICSYGSNTKIWGHAVVNHLLCLASANTDNLDAIVRKLVPSWAWNQVTMWYRTVDMNWVLTYVTVFEVDGEKRNVFYSVWITVFGTDWKGLLVI